MWLLSNIVCFLWDVIILCVCILLVLYCFTEQCVYMSVIFCLVCVPPTPPPPSLPLSFMHKDEDSCFILLSWMCCSLLVKFRTDYLCIKFRSEKNWMVLFFKILNPIYSHKLSEWTMGVKIFVICALLIFSLKFGCLLSFSCLVKALKGREDGMSWRWN